MGIVLIIVLIALCLAVVLIVIGHRNKDMSLSLSVEPIEDVQQELYWEDSIALEFFAMSNKIVEFKEVDGTSGVYIMDRKTHSILAYVLHSDGIIKLVKQVQQEKKQ